MNQAHGTLNDWQRTKKLHRIITVDRVTFLFFIFFVPHEWNRGKTFLQFENLLFFLAAKKKKKDIIFGPFFRFTKNILWRICVSKWFCAYSVHTITQRKYEVSKHEEKEAKNV